ncbi:hypothetical protein GE061_017024 [Apolygus lucorum]|uniref:Uncharacterized protein n=1 Tax=Apolygus lucorum TaxID=248454 RepID=A0A6A4K5E6_APOLU|nr:hypothetical protein GE061_017024 [Apolygus lucorum]
MGFHAAVGTPLMRLPTINGQEVDLLGLFESVTGLGGWERVSDNNQWPEVVSKLELPDACVNSSVALKQIYLRFLDKYEKTHFVHKVRGETEDEVEFNIRRMNKQSARTLYGVPTTYNNDQHRLTEEQRLLLGLNALSERDKFEKLQLSLISPLPNEQDFAINVCSLLSLHAYDHPVRLSKSPRLLSNLLAHAGVFSDVYFKDFMCEVYQKDRGHDMKSFWINSLKHDALVWISNEANFTGTQDEDCLMVDFPERSYMTENLTNCDFFIERVCQIARIIVNLTQHVDNSNFLAADMTAVRFILLCCDCRFKKVSELGWDMLYSIASKMCIRTLGFKEIMFIVKENVLSEDISEVLASLRVLSEIAKVDVNKTPLMDCIDHDMFSKLCTYLTLQDVVIILCTLEALYALSQLDTIFCDMIVRTTGSLSVLVLLLKFRVPLSASFGTWKNIRVLETLVSEDGSRNLAEKDLGALSVRPPELPYPYYLNNSVPAMEAYRRVDNIANCCLTGECRRSQKDDGGSTSKENVITLQTSPRKNSLLCNALRNCVPNGIKPVTVSTVGPAITLKAHLEEPVTKIVKITNPGNQSLLNTVKNMSNANPSLLKNVGFVTKKMMLNGKEFVVATPMSPPSKSSEESNSSNSDDFQDKIVTNNHSGSEESMDSIKNNGEVIKKDLVGKGINRDGENEVEIVDYKQADSGKQVGEMKIAVDESKPGGDKMEKSAPLMNGIQGEVKVNGVPEPDNFLCEWRGCLRKFKTPNGVYVHICSAHCPQSMLEGKCLWGSCTAGKMVYRILIKHIQREHCHSETMLPIKVRAAIRPRPHPSQARGQPPLSSRAQPPLMPPPLPPAPVVMTAPAPEQFNPSMVPSAPQMPPPPQQHPPPPVPPLPSQAPYGAQFPPRYYGPPPLATTPAGDRIAESVRLTSALILRNLAISCPTARRRLLVHEQQIVEAAALDSEASRAAAECLSYLWT